MRGSLARGFLVLLAVGCGTSTPSGYAPYSGSEPYPDKRPKLTLPSGEVGFLTNSYSDTIDVVRMDTVQRIASYPVGRIPFDVDGPHHLAIDKPSRALYVALSYPVLAASSGPHSGHGASQRAGYVQKLSLTDFGELGEAVRVDENPGDITLSDDARRLVVTHFDLSRATSKALPPDERQANLVVIDPIKNFANPSSDVTRIRVCRAPHGVVLSPGAGQIAYVACYADDAIAKVDLDTKQVTKVPLGAAINEGDAPLIGPYAIALSPTASKLALGSTDGKDLRLVDATTLTQVQSPIPLGAAVYFPAWAPDESKLYVPTQQPDSLRVVSATSGQVVAQRAFAPGECEKPHEVRVSKDGKRLFVVCEGDHVGLGAVVALDITTLEIAARQATGVYPDRLVTLEGP